MKDIRRRAAASVAVAYASAVIAAAAYAGTTVRTDASGLSAVWPVLVTMPSGTAVTALLDLLVGDPPDWAEPALALAAMPLGGLAQARPLWLVMRGRRRDAG